jgi:hypothetical protein
LLLEREFLIYPADSPLSAEMRNFRQDEQGRRNSAPGHHDDVIMSSAIAFALIDEMDFVPIEFHSSGIKRVADTIEDFLR